MVDIDGVISLFGVSLLAHADPRRAKGRSIRSRAYPTSFRPSPPRTCLISATLFELVWASGWEERADEHLPHLLGLPAGLPFLRFARSVGRSNAHWKLDAIEAHAAGRALAWVDDALDDECRAWAHARPAPTLLVQTEPQRGSPSGRRGCWRTGRLSWRRAERRRRREQQRR